MIVKPALPARIKVTARLFDHRLVFRHVIVVVSYLQRSRSPGRPAAQQGAAAETVSAERVSTVSSFAGSAGSHHLGIHPHHVRDGIP